MELHSAHVYARLMIAIRTAASVRLARREPPWPHFLFRPLFNSISCAMRPRGRGQGTRRSNYNIYYHIDVNITHCRSNRRHFASRPRPNILRRSLERHRFITTRIISRLTLGRSLSISAIPNGPRTFSSAYAIKSALEPRAGRSLLARSSNSRYAIRRVDKK